MELAMFLTNYTNIELAMISLERCESITKIQTEKIIDIKDQPVKVKNSKNNEYELIDIWPNKGEIEIKNFSIKYRENLPIILNDINIKINAKEKIGIVGRTGSGKSSLVMSLCRIIESDIGEIIIDNVDIRKLNLQFLRQNITIVPQDIFLMEGTLKENIDPLNKKTENEIIEILNKYSIFPEITDNNERLNFYIKQNGDNLSIGQKQLICFARAGIIKSKILILDEATSYVDLQTEKIIKTNLENDFRDSTVIIIAHHIQMVSHCEKILVIDDGKIVEIDTYDNLLNNKNSKFYALYNESLAN
jgi:ABC-type multidrug transport system fused ATPase/permease subunit